MEYLLNLKAIYRNRIAKLLFKKEDAEYAIKCYREERKYEKPI